MTTREERHVVMPEENPFRSIEASIAFSSRGWSLDKRDAWVYGIVLGWGDALEEVAERHGWDADTTARLRRLRVRYEQVTGAPADDMREVDCRNPSQEGP